jgi:hypothetical protein
MLSVRCSGHVRPSRPNAQVAKTRPLRNPKSDPMPARPTRDRPPSIVLWPQMHHSRLAQCSPRNRTLLSLESRNPAKNGVGGAGGECRPSNQTARSSHLPGPQILPLCHSRDRASLRRDAQQLSTLPKNATWTRRLSLKTFYANPSKSESDIIAVRPSSEPAPDISSLVAMLGNGLPMLTFEFACTPLNLKYARGIGFQLGD